ncbi:adenosylcobinamide-GDP ribazoletransferase [Aliiroseovarius subalbicans]|uniref:adenosylcobinamide-GDP ribazoletransferase n=1 Tax=Aliiroseovarius subalbicans TaxID=2925840 RepID=UPI001F5A88EC|nr:adenosylcobinamide-GDP ribazoletransferase [Aliiroseovarius subalbicans]MCI2398084.1 adenosylcobinamide-GDP ribazoletransferase [Aliiroseovarius subalbicans]
MPHRDIAAAIGLLTRLPVRLDAEHAQSRGAQAAWAWPLAGALVGGMAAGVGLVAFWLGTPSAIAAGLALAAQVMMTGALHEDGLADTADGLWGGHDTARRLEIMKDSRIGAYGVIALVLSLLLRWSAMTLLLDTGGFLVALVATGALSRAPMAVLASALPNARDTGLSHSVGRPDQAVAMQAVALALAVGFVLAGWVVIAAGFWIALSGIALAALTKSKIGGQTGDTLGAGQQLAEITTLAVFASLAT